jgi:hypothetical protein
VRVNRTQRIWGWMALLVGGLGILYWQLSYVPPLPPPALATRAQVLARAHQFCREVHWPLPGNPEIKEDPQGSCWWLVKWPERQEHGEWTGLTLCIDGQTGMVQRTIWKTIPTHHIGQHPVTTTVEAEAQARMYLKCAGIPVPVEQLRHLSTTYLPKSQAWRVQYQQVVDRYEGYACRQSVSIDSRSGVLRKFSGNFVQPPRHLFRLIPQSGAVAITWIYFLTHDRGSMTESSAKLTVIPVANHKTYKQTGGRLAWIIECKASLSGLNHDSLVIDATTGRILYVYKCG